MTIVHQYVPLPARQAWLIGTTRAENAWQGLAIFHFHGYLICCPRYCPCGMSPLGWMRAHVELLVTTCHFGRFPSNVPQLAHSHGCAVDSSKHTRPYFGAPQIFMMEQCVQINSSISCIQPSSCAYSVWQATSLQICLERSDAVSICSRRSRSSRHVHHDTSHIMANSSSLPQHNEYLHVFTHSIYAYMQREQSWKGLNRNGTSSCKLW